MSITGAVYIGLSGMNAYSDGLQIISNNVANLNTNGYKAETVSFADIYNAGGGNLLGEEASGDGEGVKVSTPGTDFSEGTLQQTGNALDLAVQGDGFLVLQSGGQTYYTRTGSFTVGTNGDISLEGTPTGTTYNLAILDSANQPIAANVNGNSTSTPSATTTITLGDNLSTGATTATVSDITVYDSLGTSHTWTLTATPASGSSTTATGVTSWSIAVTDETGATVGSGTIDFNGSTPDSSNDTLTINSTPSDGAAPLAVTLDFSGVTSFNAGSSSTLQTTKVDGSASGTLSSVAVNSSGDVVLSYSNNTTKTLGAVALAYVQNPQTLTNIGNGLYTNASSQQLELEASGSTEAGSVVSGQLEGSNVNLTQEFGDLILIQRGYQASSEVVSISNDMIQQLFGIRGQG